MESTWKSATKEEVEDVIKRYNQIKEKIQLVVEKYKLKQVLNSSNFLLKSLPSSQ